MSIEYNTYVGTYARCVITLVEHTKTKLACSNPTCPNSPWDTVGVFCSRCGSPNRSVSYVQMFDSVDERDVSQQLNERLVTPSGDAYATWASDNLTHIWLPNAETSLRNGTLDSRSDFALLALTSADVASEIESFSTLFAAEFAMLRTIYGESAVSVAWGVIQDYY